jgi:hypothetical protein
VREQEQELGLEPELGPGLEPELGPELGLGLELERVMQSGNKE